MNVGFYQIVSTDCLLALVLLGLFVYASRVSQGVRGIAGWGVAHLLYTLGAALLDGTVQDTSAAARSDAQATIALGSLLACGGLAGLALSMIRFVQQRRLRARELALLPLCIGASLAVSAAGGNGDAQGALMTVVELLMLAILIAQLWRFRSAPYRTPARLMVLACVALFAIYAIDLYNAWLGQYGPSARWINADISLWFMLNFCMLMLTSFHVSESLRRSALLDPLTAVLNRRGLNSELRDRLGRGGKHAHLAVIALDVDHFKAINDKYKHGAGDAVLRHVCEATQACIRSDDLFARLGGDEFVVVMTGLDAHMVMQLAERIRRKVDALRLPAPLESLPVTVSLGVCVSDAAMPVQDAINHADEALYLAKRRGRNRVELHHQPVPADPLLAATE